MKIRNEAARLFFAISALILVGMLSTPAGDLKARNPEEISPSKLISSEKKSVPKNKNAIKFTDRRKARKIVMK